MAKLGDVCTIVSGTTPKSNCPEYWDGGINWVTPAELNDDSDVIYESQRKITEQAVQDSSLKPFPAGTVLLSSRAPIGKVAIAGVEMYCNQGFKNLICSNRIYNRYLYYFLKNSTEYLNSLGRGATFKEISKSIVENIEIPLPSLDEQRRIAAVLDKVSGLIAKRREQLDKLDDLVKARFVEMFGDPVLNPMDWPTYHLADMADIVSGITKGRKTKEKDLIEVPYMAVSNVKDGYIDWTTIKIILATQSEIDQYRLLPGDVLMTEGGDPDKLGRGAIIQNMLENCIHQNHIFRVRLNENVILPVYFAEFLQHQKAKQYFLQCAKQTTGIASINMTQLRGLPTLVPPRALQKDFTNTVEQINKSKLTIQQSLDKLEVLKKALMQQYFR